jgi:hypothetical protein
MGVSVDGFIADREGADVAIGGAGLAGAAIELGLVDELGVFRRTVPP